MMSGGDCAVGDCAVGDCGRCFDNSDRSYSDGDCGGDNGNSGGHCVTGDGGYVLVIVVIVIMV